jgi:hypothetical protein
MTRDGPLSEWRSQHGGQRAVGVGVGDVRKEVAKTTRTGAVAPVLVVLTYGPDL